LLKRKVEDLSVGERRILEVLMMVRLPCSFLLLDEPFTGIAPVVKEALCNILLSCKGRKGIIITDHDYESVLSLVDRVVLLQNGSTKPIRDPEELVGYGYLSRDRYDEIFAG
jgi:ABC-type lipopolysaccharide export system ATPase subunit